MRQQLEAVVALIADGQYERASLVAKQLIEYCPTGVVDPGLWQADVTGDGRVFVESDHFNRDVRLYVNGDFPRSGSTEELDYATGIAAMLNSCTTTHVILKDALATFDAMSQRDPCDCGCPSASQGRLLKPAHVYALSRDAAVALREALGEVGE